MTFVNQIAEIVHGVVDECWGAVNKNDGPEGRDRGKLQGCKCSGLSGAFFRIINGLWGLRFCLSLDPDSAKWLQVTTSWSSGDLESCPPMRSTTRCLHNSLNSACEVLGANRVVRLRCVAQMSRC